MPTWMVDARWTAKRSSASRCIQQKEYQKCFLGNQSERRSGNAYKSTMPKQLIQINALDPTQTFRMRHIFIGVPTCTFENNNTYMLTVCHGCRKRMVLLDYMRWLSISVTILFLFGLWLNITEHQYRLHTSTTATWNYVNEGTIFYNSKETQ